MCKVNMDLSVEKNLKFAVYSLMLSKHEEFSLNELTEDIMKYQNLDQELLNKKISLLLKNWVISGVLQEHLDTFSIV